MAEETITILRVGTDEAVRSVNDLKNNVKILKEQLGELEIGTEKYQNTLEELKINQNAVKDAMYASTASLNDVTKAATGTGESYNSLVHRMAALKEELRATDVSTVEGAARFKDLAKQVDDVNTRLKEMDALQGNFQRNVGNYKSALSGLKDGADAFGKSLGVAGKGINGVKDSADALMKSPMIATFGILVSLALRLADNLKENEKASAAFKKGLDALKPVMSFIAGITDKLVDTLVNIIEKVTSFVTSNGLFSKILDGIIGVGNAIVQYVIAPFKGIAAAIKVFQEEGITGIGNAAKAFANEAKNGIAFRQNFIAGQNVAESIVKGAESKKAEVKDAGVELGKEVGKGVEEGLKLSDWEKALAEGDRKLQERRKQREQEQKELAALVASDTESTIDYVDGILQEYYDAQDKAMEKAQESMEMRALMMNNVASATSSILSSIADMYEANEESAEKNAEKIKGLRIASATIDTIQGAISAYMNAVSMVKGPAGIALGVIQAATVTAAGMAQIAKMRSTNIKGTSTPSVSAIQSAPAAESRIPQIRNVTSASEEVRLNRMADDSRVVLVMSDLEVKQGQRKVQLAESSF